MKTAILEVLSFAVLSSAMAVVCAETAQEAWVARYNGPGNGKDNAVALAIDGAGSAYVTGFSDGGGGNYDFATIKYDGEGKQVWVARYDADAHGADWARAVAVTADGNVVVTGSSAGKDSGFDFATVKYDPAGNQLWVSRYDGPAHGDDRVTALAVDADGNVYVAGDSSGENDAAEAVTVKYGADGNLLWAARSGSPGGGQSVAAIALDGEGNVYVTGRASREAGNTDYVAVKYDPTGKVLWTARRDWSAHDDARYLAVDGAGNVYVAGDIVSHTEGSEMTAHQDMGLVKFGPDGDAIWSVSFNGGDGNNDVAAGIRLGPDGSIYLSGTTLSSGGPGAQSPPPAEFVTARYDPDGALLWTARHEGVEQGVSMAQRLALDAAGNAYVLASVRGVPDRTPALTLIKYSAQGEEQWVVGHAGSATTANGGVSVGADGTVWIAGSDASGSDYLTVEYAQSERSAWHGTSGDR